MVILAGRLRIKIIKTLHSVKQYVFGSAIGTTHCVVATLVAAFPNLKLQAMFTAKNRDFCNR